MTRRDVALLILILLLGGVITTAQKVRRGLSPHLRVEGLEFLEGPLHTFPIPRKRRRRPAAG